MSGIEFLAKRQTLFNNALETSRATNCDVGVVLIDPAGQIHGYYTSTGQIKSWQDLMGKLVSYGEPSFLATHNDVYTNKSMKPQDQQIQQLEERAMQQLRNLPQLSQVENIAPFPFAQPFMISTPAAQVNVAPVAPVKRPRGRPRKPKPDPLEKRPAGRPRKKPLDETQTKALKLKQLHKLALKRAEEAVQKERGESQAPAPQPIEQAHRVIESDHPLATVQDESDSDDSDFVQPSHRGSDDSDSESSESEEEQVEEQEKLNGFIVEDLPPVDQLRPDDLMYTNVSWQGILASFLPIPPVEPMENPESVENFEGFDQVPTQQDHLLEILQNLVSQATAPIPVHTASEARPLDQALIRKKTKETAGPSVTYNNLNNALNNHMLQQNLQNNLAPNLQNNISQNLLQNSLFQQNSNLFNPHPIVNTILSNVQPVQPNLSPNLTSPTSQEMSSQEFANLFNNVVNSSQSQ